MKLFMNHQVMFKEHTERVDNRKILHCNLYHHLLYKPFQATH